MFKILHFLHTFFTLFPRGREKREGLMEKKRAGGRGRGSGREREREGGREIIGVLHCSSAHPRVVVPCAPSKMRLASELSRETKVSKFPICALLSSDPQRSASFRAVLNSDPQRSASFRALLSSDPHRSASFRAALR